MLFKGGGPAGGYPTASDQFHLIPTQQEKLARAPAMEIGFFFLFYVFFLNASVWDYILVAKKLVSYCRLSESKDKATVKIACYFDSSHIITINDIVYL